MLQVSLKITANRKDVSEICRINKFECKYHDASNFLHFIKASGTKIYLN